MTQRLLRYFVRCSQKQYLDHLRSKKDETSLERETSIHNSKVCDFKLELLDNALTLHASLKGLEVDKIQTFSKTAMNNCRSSMDELSQKLDLQTLKKMAASKKYHEFIEVFLTNKLCLKLQKAMRDQALELNMDEMPLQMHLLESILVGDQDGHDMPFQFQNEANDYYYDIDCENGEQAEYNQEGTPYKAITANFYDINSVGNYQVMAKTEYYSPEYPSEKQFFIAVNEQPAGHEEQGQGPNS